MIPLTSTYSGITHYRFWGNAVAWNENGEGITLDGIVWSVQSEFNFSVQELEAMEVSYEPLNGILFWYEGVEALVKSVKDG